MQEDALEKLKAGVTTLEEIIRVVPMEALATSECERCGQELPPRTASAPIAGLDAGPEHRIHPQGHRSMSRKGSFLEEAHNAMKRHPYLVVESLESNI